MFGPICMFGRHLRAGPRPHIRPFAAGRSPTRERTSTHPVQNSPNTPPPAAQPVQNSPNTPKKAHFSQFCTSRENFVPHPPPRPPAGRTLYRAQCQTRYKTPPTRPRQQPNRYKTLPVQPVRRPNRYKTLPTRPKRPISASFARAGRTLYRIHPHDPQQGELCTAPSAKPGTKLPQHAPASSPPGTKLSQRPRSTAIPRKSSPSTPHTTTEPRKSSPSTPKNGVFRLFRACRANYFAHKQATSHAGRTYSRRGVDRTR